MRRRRVLSDNELTEELVEDQIEPEELAGELPSDEEERFIAAPERREVITLARAYDHYLARGGNRSLPERVLALFD